MAVSMTNEQFATGQITPQTKHGHPASVEAGTVKFDVADPSIATVTQDTTDETKFTLTAVAPGVTQLNFSGDADLGSGVSTITGFLAVEVTQAGAVGFGVTTSDPQDQP